LGIEKEMHMHFCGLIKWFGCSLKSILGQNNFIGR